MERSDIDIWKVRGAFSNGEVKAVVHNVVDT